MFRVLSFKLSESLEPEIVREALSLKPKTQDRRANDGRRSPSQQRIGDCSRGVHEYCKLDSLVSSTVRLPLKLGCGLRTILSHLLHSVHRKVEEHCSLLIHRHMVKIKNVAVLAVC